MILFIPLSIMMSTFLFIAMCFLLEEKLDFRDKKLYLYYIFCVVIGILNCELEYFKILNNTLVFIGLAKAVFNKSLKSSIIIGILLIILFAISEAFVVLVDMFTFKIVEKPEFFFIFLINICILVVHVLLCRTKAVRKLYTAFLEITNKIKEKQIVIFSITIIFIYNTFVFISYYALRHSIDGYYLAISSTVLTVICAIIVFNYFKSYTNYLKFYEKYSLSLESIREYEEMLERYRLYSHENKNQLMIIRNICKNKKTVEYIDTLINNELTDDEQLLIEADKIPNGGLRGLLYSKMVLMKDKKISFELIIDKKINLSKTCKFPDNLLTDICMIAGVFIDNAIEAVQDLDEKYISIEVYAEGNDIAIAITNNYVGYIDMDNISASNYSTKGETRGYGLALVEKIICRNKSLENIREVVNDNFTQILIIKKPNKNLNQ